MQATPRKGTRPHSPSAPHVSWVPLFPWYTGAGRRKMDKAKCFYFPATPDGRPLWADTAMAHSSPCSSSPLHGSQEREGFFCCPSAPAHYPPQHLPQGSPHLPSSSPGISKVVNPTSFLRVRLARGNSHPLRGGCEVSHPTPGLPPFGKPPS